MKKIGFVWLWVVCFLGCAVAQSQYALSAHWLVGKPLRHTPKLTFPIPPLATGAAANFERTPLLPDDFAVRYRWQRYPTFGVALTYMYLGSPTLGSMISLAPYIVLPVVQRSAYQLDFKLQTGVAFATHPYNELTNPANNAIGSVVTNMTALEWRARWHTGRICDVTTTLSLLHYSNGSSQLPNFGINIPTLSVGAAYKFTQSVPVYAFVDTLPPMHNRWGMMLYGHWALRELIGIGGPRYPVYTLSGGATYHFHPFWRMMAGVAYEYHKGVYVFGLHNRNFLDPAAAHRAATRWAAWVGSEWLVQDFSIYLQSGVYLNAQQAFLIPAWYNKLGIRYYLPWSMPIKPHLGVYLKAHGFTAEYIAWGIGFQL